MPLRVLVVEDEQVVRDTLCRKLSRDGYEVDGAADGLAAEKALGDRAYDLVLLDLIMPVRDGLETIRFMSRRHPDVRVIAMSSPSSLMLLECATLMGAHGTLEKPFRHADVDRAISSVLGKAQSSRAGKMRAETSPNPTR